MASEAAFKYLTDTNRPYSCADVTTNLRGAFPKSAIQKALDTLSDSGKIKCKLYGKQKVYAAIQQDNNDNTDDEDVDTKLKETTKAVTEKQATLKKIESALRTLTSTPTTGEAKMTLNEKNSNIEKISNKINNLKGTTCIISVEERKAILDEHENLVKEYRKRKRICTDMIEAMMEGYPKSKKVFLDELCIETDEMVNFKLIT